MGTHVVCMTTFLMIHQLMPASSSWSSDFNLTIAYVDNHFSGTYRVFSKGRNEVGPSKSLIFWTFSDVLGFFRPFNMGDFSFWYFWDI